MRTCGLIAAIWATVFLLDGCATQMPSSSSEIPHNSILGSWVVTDAYPSGRENLQEAGVVVRGRSVLITENQASDVAGRICTTPVYQFAVARRDRVFGYRENDMAHAAAPTSTVQVLCGAEPPFLSLVALDDRMLLVADSSRWLRLERAESALPTLGIATPFALASDHAESPAPIPLPPISQPPVSHQVTPTATNYLYLASYRNQTGGIHAWELFKKAAPALANMQVVMMPINIPGRGQFVRIYATADSDQEFRAICQQVHKLARDCGSAAMRWKEAP